jgi:hypothetical protein
VLSLSQVPENIGQLWADPLPEGGKRHLAADMKGLGSEQKDMPEWQRASLGGTKVSYGKKTTMSIIEQRESLPIYALKRELVTAILENQVCVCVCVCVRARARASERAVRAYASVSAFAPPPPPPPPGKKRKGDKW